MIDYEEIARACRLKVLDLIYQAQTSHIASNFSCIDILTVLFTKIDLDKDKFILSKGWAAASLYYFLWKNGRITKEELDSYCKDGSKFIGLSEPIIPDIPFAGGSMGLGLPAGIGFALSKKLKNDNGHVYVLASDGEMNCGTTWEAVAIAAHHKLSNLTLIVDINRFQAMGKTHDILGMSSLLEKFKSFAWDAIEINGHNFPRIEKALSLTKGERPYVILAHTVKGMGVPQFENNNIYHYKQLSEKEYKEALQTLA